MAIQDKFDSAFAEKLLKKTLLANKTQTPTATVANDNTHELTKSNLVTISNSFTSLQNAFNKIYAHTLNVRNLHQYEEKRISNIKRENNLENKITPSSAPALSTNNTGSSLASTASTLDDLASSVEKLNEKMKNVKLSGGGDLLSTAGNLGLSALSFSKYGGKLLGPLSIGIDAFGRYQEGQSTGQIAAGVGGGAAGAYAGAELGAAAGGAIGAFFFGAGAIPGAAIGGAIGGIGGYFGGSYAGDTAYNALNTRATGGGVKAGGTYVIGERGPEVLMLGGLSGKVIANGQRGKTSQSEKYLTAAADKSSRAATKVIKGQPIGPTSYSSKFSNYLSSLFGNMPNWLNRIKDYLGFNNERGPDGEEALGSGQYAAVGDLSKATGDWKNDTEFITAVNNVAQKYNIDANDLLGLMYNESAGSMSPSIRGGNGATGLFQFMPQYFDTAAVARMTRAEQVALADEKIFAASGLPRGANAGQIYASVFLPGIARSQGWQGVLTREGENYYESNARDKQGRRSGLDVNKDGMIDYNDLANKISGHRVRMGLGPSPSLVGAMSTQGFVTPVRGSVGSGFGMRTLNGFTRPHEGLDYPIPAGTPVRAAKGGTIISASTISGYGNTIIIDHGNGVTTRYAHLRQFLKTTGTVQQGEIIARSGGVPGEPGAGTSTGAHLHFEVRMNGVSVNPEAYLAAAATPEQRTPSTGLPAGYRREGRADAQRRTTIPYIITPNGSSFPASISSVQGITNFNSLNPQTQNEILTYFKLK